MGDKINANSNNINLGNLNAWDVVEDLISKVSNTSSSMDANSVDSLVQDLTSIFQEDLLQVKSDHAESLFGRVKILQRKLAQLPGFESTVQALANLTIDPTTRATGWGWVPEMDLSASEFLNQILRDLKVIKSYFETSVPYRKLSELELADQLAQHREGNLLSFLCPSMGGNPKPRQIEVIADIFTPKNLEALLDLPDTIPQESLLGIIAVTMWACANFDIEVRDLVSRNASTDLRDLLRAGQDVNRKFLSKIEETVIGWSTELPPLHLAATLGHVDCAKALLEFGADINLLGSGWMEQGDDTQVLFQAYSPLSMAILHEQIDVARLLLENGTQVNIPSGEFSHLWTAIRSKKTDGLQLLLDFGADINWYGKLENSPTVGVLGYAAKKRVKGTDGGSWEILKAHQKKRLANKKHSRKLRLKEGLRTLESLNTQILWWAMSLPNPEEQWKEGLKTKVVKLLSRYRDEIRKQVISLRASS